jgi:hypothetical protein
MCCNKPYLLGTPVTADNCTVASVTNNAPASYSVGTTNVVWTVTDASGNTRYLYTSCDCDQIIKCQQLFVLPTLQINVNAGQCVATGVALGTPTTSDNCGVATVTNNAPASYSVGTTNVVWTVVDDSRQLIYMHSSSNS